MEYVTVPVAAREVGIAPRRLHRAIQEGELEGVRLGRRWIRVERAAVRAWVRRNRVEPAAERGRRRARGK